MRSFHGDFLVAGVALALLTGCSGGGNIGTPQVGGATQQAALRAENSTGPSALRTLLLSGKASRVPRVAARSFMNLAAMAKNEGNTIAISDIENNYVDLFTAAGTLVGQLTGFDFPAGMASDIKGDLYVADARDARVLVYAAGFTSPPKTLQDPGQLPYDVDSFANGAYVAVANTATASGGQGSVSIFKDWTLQSTLAYSNLSQVLFCAFDASGNLYVDGFGPRDEVVVGEIPNATAGGTTFRQLTTANFISQAAGIQVTTSGQIAIEDVNNKAIYTYDPPSGGSLGTPTQITPLGGSHSPVSFAFTKDMADLYAADLDSNHTLEYAYPIGGKPVSRIGFHAYGIAVVPTEYPKSGSL